MHTSVFSEIEGTMQEVADATALHVLNQLSDWLKEEGHKEIAEQMLAEFSAPSENSETATQETAEKTAAPTDLEQL